MTTEATWEVSASINEQSVTVDAACVIAGHNVLRSWISLDKKQALRLADRIIKAASLLDDQK